MEPLNPPLTIIAHTVIVALALVGALDQAGGVILRRAGTEYVSRPFKRPGNGRCRPVARADRRRDQAGRGGDRRQLPISAGDREDGIGFQSDRRRLALFSARALSVHRPDLAW